MADCTIYVDVITPTPDDPREDLRELHDYHLSTIGNLYRGAAVVARPIPGQDDPWYGAASSYGVADGVTRVAYRWPGKGPSAAEAAQRITAYLLANLWGDILSAVWVERPDGAADVPIRGTITTYADFAEPFCPTVDEY